MEDDVDVWRYAVLELHARNDDDDLWHYCQACVLFISIHLCMDIVVLPAVSGKCNKPHLGWVNSPNCAKFGTHAVPGAEIQNAAS